MKLLSILLIGTLTLVARSYFIYPLGLADPLTLHIALSLGGNYSIFLRSHQLSLLLGRQTAFHFSSSAGTLLLGITVCGFIKVKILVNLKYKHPISGNGWQTNGIVSYRQRPIMDLNSHQPRKKGTKVQKMHGGNVKANYP